VQVSELYTPDERARVVCIGLLLVMLGGCSAAVAFDSRNWADVMCAAMVRLPVPYHRARADERFR